MLREPNEPAQQRAACLAHPKAPPASWRFRSWFSWISRSISVAEDMLLPSCSQSMCPTGMMAGVGRGVLCSKQGVSTHWGMPPAHATCAMACRQLVAAPRQQIAPARLLRPWLTLRELLNRSSIAQGPSSRGRTAPVLSGCPAAHYAAI